MNTASRIPLNDQRWFEYLEMCEKWYTENDRDPKFELTNLPLSHLVTAKERHERRLYNWMCQQKHYYKHKKYRMQFDKYRRAWETFLQCIHNVRVWNKNIKLYEEFVDKHSRKPMLSSSDQDESNLAKWYYTQKCYPDEYIDIGFERMDDNYVSYIR
jgi:hypothetical protein